VNRDIETQAAKDGVATLALARPERRNALSIKLRDEITQQLEDWTADRCSRLCSGSSASASRASSA
jgi:enoyl-CoA hydratase/carnithine racemase